MNTKLLFLLPVISIFLLLIPTVLAQQSEILPILGSILGEIPPVCSSDASVCIGCLVTTKVFPLLFFVAIFFLILLMIVASMSAKRTSKETEATENLAKILSGGDIRRHIPTQFVKIAAILAIILSLFTLNLVGLQALEYMKWWVGIFIFMFLLFVVRGMHMGGVMWPFIIIFIIVITIVTSSFLSGLELEKLYSHCY